MKSDQVVIGEKEYADRMRACWLGKNIGGTLGAPYECKKEINNLDFFRPVPDKAAPNDDLDLQLVWLKMLEDQGPDTSIRTFARYWHDFARRYPWNEYGFFMRNYSRGLLPPVAGCFENYFVDEMGSPIRSEIWACLHPGDPDSAARMAWKDSCLDHAGGEGTCGEMFWAALEAAAFVESDPMTLIRIGLNMIPLSSHVGRSIREAIWCHENAKTWEEARERISGRFGHLQACNAVPNHGFTIIGWLYGKDFGDCLCKAVNCGYDTDCTGATLGSLLGILGGMKGIPEKWSAPVGERIVLHKFTGDCGAPGTISELTERTLALARRSLRAKRGFSFGQTTRLPADMPTRLFNNDQARKALAQDIHAAVEVLDGSDVWLHYGGEPVLRPGIGKDVSVSVSKKTSSRIDLGVPKGWKCRRTGPASFRILSEGPVPGRNEIAVKIGRKSALFTMLGPDEARGFEAGANVPKCPNCGARIEECLCSLEKRC